MRPSTRRIVSLATLFLGCFFCPGPSINGDPRRLNRVRKRRSLLVMLLPRRDWGASEMPAHTRTQDALRILNRLSVSSQLWAAL